MNYYPPENLGTGKAQGGGGQPAPSRIQARQKAPDMPKPNAGKMDPPPPGTTERVPYLYPPNSIQAAIGRHAFVVGPILAITTYLAFFAFHRAIPFWGIEASIAAEAGAVLLLFAMYWTCGAMGEARLTKVGIKTALTASAYPLFLSLWMGLRSDGPFAILSSMCSVGGAILAVETLIYCLLIGAFEEMMTRGLLLSGLQQKWGKTTNGLILSTFVAAIVFGALHVVPDIMAVLDGNLPLTSIVVLQMVLKTFQTGMLGVLLGAITIRTHSIWGAALIHALDDFFVMLPAHLLYGVSALSVGALSPYPMAAESYGSGYVLADPSEGAGLVFSYTIWCLMYLPFIFSAIKLIKAARLPDTGAMCEEYVAHEIEEYDRKSVVFLRPLMPLVPQWQAPAPQQTAIPYQMPYAPQWMAWQQPMAPSQTTWQTMPTPTWQPTQSVQPVQAPPMSAPAGMTPQQGYVPQAVPPSATPAGYPMHPMPAGYPTQGAYPQEPPQGMPMQTGAGYVPQPSPGGLPQQPTAPPQRPQP